MNRRLGAPQGTEAMAMVGSARRDFQAHRRGFSRGIPTAAVIRRDEREREWTMHGRADGGQAGVRAQRPRGACIGIAGEIGVDGRYLLAIQHPLRLRTVIEPNHGDVHIGAIEDPGPIALGEEDAAARLDRHLATNWVPVMVFPSGSACARRVASAVATVNRGRPGAAPRGARRSGA